MVNKMKKHKFDEYYISLFIDEYKYGLAVIGQKTIVEQKTILNPDNQFTLGWKPPKFITVESYDKHEYWLIDILEKSLSFKSIVKNLIDWVNKYRIYTIFTNRNLHTTKFLDEELKLIGKPDYLNFVYFPFVAEDSIINLRAFLNDKRLFITDDIKSKFTKGISEYNSENQITFINSIMLIIDNTYGFYLEDEFNYSISFGGI